MQGRVRVRLLEPGAADVDATGDLRSTTVVHERGALRTDRGGRRETVDAADVGEWDRRYEVRSVGLARVSQGWLLVDRDDGGRMFVIDAIDKPVGRSRMLVLSVKHRAGVPVPAVVPAVPIVPAMRDFDPRDFDPRDWG